MQKDLRELCFLGGGRDKWESRYLTSLGGGRAPRKCIRVSDREPENVSHVGNRLPEDSVRCHFLEESFPGAVERLPLDGLPGPSLRSCDSLKYTEPLELSPSLLGRNLRFGAEFSASSDGDFYLLRAVEKEFAIHHACCEETRAATSSSLHQSG